MLLKTQGDTPIFVLVTLSQWQDFSYLFLVYIFLNWDFSFLPPLLSSQFLQSNYPDSRLAAYSHCYELVKELLKHTDLRLLLKQAEKNGQKTWIAVHHGMAEIHHVMEWVKKDGEHWWCDTLVGWLPTATRILNWVLHPVVILLMLILSIFVLIIALYLKVWVIMKYLS